MKPSPSRILSCILLLGANGVGLCEDGFPPPPGPYGLASQVTEKPAEATPVPAETRATSTAAPPRKANRSEASSSRPEAQPGKIPAPPGTGGETAKPARFAPIFADQATHEVRWETQPEAKPTPAASVAVNSARTATLRGAHPPQENARPARPTPAKTGKPTLPSAQFGPVFGNPEPAPAEPPKHSIGKTPVPRETPEQHTPRRAETPSEGISEKGIAEAGGTRPAIDTRMPSGGRPSAEPATPPIEDTHAGQARWTPSGATEAPPTYPRPGSPANDARASSESTQPRNWRFAPSENPRADASSARNDTPGPASSQRPAPPAMWPPVSVHPEAGNIHIPDSRDVLHPPDASIQMRWPGPTTTTAPRAPATAMPGEGGKIKSARSLYDALTRPAGGAQPRATTSTRGTLAFPSSHAFRPDPSATARSRYDGATYPGYTDPAQATYPAPDTGMPGYYPAPGYPSGYPPRNHPGQYPPATGYAAGDYPFAGYADPAYTGSGDYPAPSWGNRYNGPPAPTESQPLPGGDSLQ